MFICLLGKVDEVLKIQGDRSALRYCHSWNERVWWKGLYQRDVCCCSSTFVYMYCVIACGKCLYDVHVYVSLYVT